MESDFCNNASGLCIHDGFERRVVRQIHAGLHTLSTKHRYEWSVGNGVSRARQELAKSLLDRYFQGLALTRRMGP